MADAHISGMTAAGALAGTEPVEVSQLSATVTKTAATISALASDNSYNDSGSGFVAAGFAVDDRVWVSGFTGNVVNNIFAATITALTAGKMTIGGADGNVIVDDAAGETVTITKWVTRRTTAQAIANLAPAVVTSWKQTVRAATAVAGTLASSFENGDTIDGVVLATGDRILIKNQAAPADNGIYTVNASGAPTRATDADAGSELVGAAVAVAEGTANADTIWICTTNAPITVGATSLVFSQLSGAASTLDGLSDVVITGAAQGDVIYFNGTNFVNLGPGTSGQFLKTLGAAANPAWAAPTEPIILACSDETTAITTGTGKVTFRMPYAFTVTAVRASVTTAPTGSTILIDINESGTTILSTKLMIDASEKTSTTAATPAVISDASLADDAEITIDFDQVGSTIAGAGVKVYLIGHQ